MTSFEKPYAMFLKKVSQDRFDSTFLFIYLFSKHVVQSHLMDGTCDKIND